MKSLLKCSDPEEECDILGYDASIICQWITDSRLNTKIRLTLLVLDYILVGCPLKTSDIQTTRSESLRSSALDETLYQFKCFIASRMKIIVEENQS